MLPRAFVSDVVDEVVLTGGPDLDGVNTLVRSRLAKLWFGNEDRIHYELAVHERAQKLEIGLHFEADAETNARLYAEFDRSLLEIQAVLGPSVWLEEWDRGWCRLYETHALWPLDVVRSHEIAERIVEFIRCVQPVYRTFASV